MIAPHKFLTRSLSQASIGPQICRILAAAINAVDPHMAVNNYLKRSDNTLKIADKIIDLATYNRVIVIGVGKASVPMTAAVCETLGNYFSEGIAITKEGHGFIPSDIILPASLQIFEAAHPLPDKRGVNGTNKIIKVLQTTNENDLIIFLISGGGSALLTSPANEITLAEIQQITSQMLACGATIHEFNCIRKHLDLVKGGQLARLAEPSTVVSLVLSDVVGDQLDVIASGPTVPDSSTYEDAIQILRALDLYDSVPPSIVSHLQAGVEKKIEDTPKVEDPLFQKVHNYLIGSNRQATEAAVNQAREEGFHTMILSNYLKGEARIVGEVIASIARQAALLNEPIPRPACIVTGGETTVTITGRGKGGRNQELALGIVEALAGVMQTIIVTLATDGGDGPTDAAGAVVTGETHGRASAQGLSTFKYLQENNSYYFFDKLSDLIKTGPTQTNVNDLTLIFTY